MSPLTKYIFRNLTARPFVTLLIVATMTLAAAAIGGVSSVGLNLRAMVNKSGNPNYLMVTQMNSGSALWSELPGDVLKQIKLDDNLRVSPETYTSIDIYTGDNVTPLTVHGFEPVGFELRRHKMIEGQLPKQGEPEVIIGETLRKRFPKLTELRIGTTTFKIVGIFQADSVLDSEAWTTRAALLAALDLRHISVILVDCGSPEAAQALAERMRKVKFENIEIGFEPESVAMQRTTGAFSQNLYFCVILVLAMMVAGTALAATSSLTSLFSRRVAEMSTLRAMGFHSSTIWRLMFIETELLALIGFGLGTLISFLVLKDYATDAAEGIYLRIPLTTEAIVASLCAMLLIGLVGMMVPLLRIVSVDVKDGLREE